MEVLLVILGIILCIVGAIYWFKKGFINFAFGVVLFLVGIVCIGNGLASDSDESYSSRNEYYDDTDDESSSGEVSFRGRQAVADYNYGRCNSGCGCTQYAHYPGQSACVNCAENGCSTNKFGHEH